MTPGNPIQMLNPQAAKVRSKEMTRENDETGVEVKGLIIGPDLENEIQKRSKVKIKIERRAAELKLKHRQLRTYAQEIQKTLNLDGSVPLTEKEERIITAMAEAFDSNERLLSRLHHYIGGFKLPKSMQVFSTKLDDFFQQISLVSQTVDNYARHVQTVSEELADSETWNNILFCRDLTQTNLEKDVAIKDRSISLKDKEIEDLNKDVETANASRTEKNRQITDLQMALDEEKNNNRSLQNKNKVLAENLQESETELKENKTKMQSKINTGKKEWDELMVQYDQINANFSKMRKEKDTAMTEIHQVKEDISRLQLTRNTALDEVRQFRDRMATFQILIGTATFPDLSRLDHLLFADVTERSHNWHRTLPGINPGEEEKYAFPVLLLERLGHEHGLIEFSDICALTKATIPISYKLAIIWAILRKTQNQAISREATLVHFRLIEYMMYQTLGITAVMDLLSPVLQSLEPPQVRNLLRAFWEWLTGKFRGEDITLNNLLDQCDAIDAQGCKFFSFGTSLILMKDGSATWYYQDKFRFTIEGSEMMMGLVLKQSEDAANDRTVLFPIQGNVKAKKQFPDYVGRMRAKKFGELDELSLQW